MPQSRSHKDQVREYSGYEDYSPSGRATIKKFNEEGGSRLLDPKKTSQESYNKAVKSAREAGHEVYRETKQGSKQSIDGREIK